MNSVKVFIVTILTLFKSSHNVNISQSTLLLLSFILNCITRITPLNMITKKHQNNMSM